MRLEQQYRELLRLKEEINIRLSRGTDFQNIKALMLALAEDQGYQILKRKENQIIILDCCLGIWLEEKRRLPELGIETDILDRISSLDELEQRYQKIKFCGFRIENKVPEEYIGQALAWLKEQKVSGLAIGIIFTYETKCREDNLLHIAGRLKQEGDLLNAILLLQYARKQYPKQEKILLEEADCWLQGQQWQRAQALLQEIENPTAEILEIIEGLQRVTGNAGQT